MHFTIILFHKEISSFTFVLFFQGLKWRTLIFQQTIVYLFNVMVLKRSYLRGVMPFYLKYAIKFVSIALTRYHYIIEIEHCII